MRSLPKVNLEGHGGYSECTFNMCSGSFFAVGFLGRGGGGGGGKGDTCMNGMIERIEEGGGGKAHQGTH